MKYFRQRKFKIESKEKVESLLNQSTSKVLTMFELTQTSTYVISEERPLVGQRLDTGEVLISRYRHIIFQIVPRIISRWKIESVNGEVFLVVQNRLGFAPTFVLVAILFPILVEVIKSIIDLRMPDLEMLAYSLFFLGLFFILAWYEIRQTDRTISKVINNEGVKSLVTILIIVRAIAFRGAARTPSLGGRIII